MSEQLAIEVTGLKKSYGDTRVLDGIELRVGKGGVFAMLGPNGAGKTTTVRILATLTEASDGTALVAGHDVVSQRREVRRRISLTGQYVALDELQTGAENLQMIGRLLGLRGRAATSRARELLEQFDLTEAGSRRVGTYSGGMRRRLDLAASLISRPQVIFLDEPTTGLDPRGRQGMWEVVTALAGTGVTVFLTTQYLDEADRLADRIAVLDGGRIVAEGTAEELKRNVSDRRLDLRAFDPGTFAELTTRAGEGTIVCDRTTLTVGVGTDGGAGEVRALLDRLDPDGLLVESFSLHTATLDDVFMTLTATNESKEPTHA